MLVRQAIVLARDNSLLSGFWSDLVGFGLIRLDFSPLNHRPRRSAVEVATHILTRSPCPASAGGRNHTTHIAFGVRIGFDWIFYALINSD